MLAQLRGRAAHVGRSGAEARSRAGLADAPSTGVDAGDEGLVGDDLRVFVELLDAAHHYPEGGTASFLGARSAAQRGDVSAAIPLLRRAEENHAARFSILLTDPGLAPIRRDPAFQELVREMAGRWIEKARRRGVTTQPEYRIVGLAHQVRGEYALAAEAFERALAIGGFQDDLVREELVRVRERMPGSG